MFYFVFRAAKLDPDFEIPSVGESASSNSDSDESSGESWCDRSLLPMHEQSTNLVYESCLHELFTYCIKCGKQILSNVTEALISIFWKPANITVYLCKWYIEFKLILKCISLKMQHFLKTSCKFVEHFFLIVGV